MIPFAVASGVLTLTSTATVLCAETSWDWRDAHNVMQVARNRVKSVRFPGTYLDVVTQKRAFSHRCRKGWMRDHHWKTAYAGISGKALRSHPKVKNPRVLFFLTIERYWGTKGKKSKREAWRKFGLVAYIHSQWQYVKRWKRKCKRIKPNRRHRLKACRGGHIYVKYSKKWLGID